MGRSQIQRMINDGRERTGNLCSGSGDQLQSVLQRFALQGRKFALLTTAIKFLGTPVYQDLSSGEQSIVETSQDESDWMVSVAECPYPIDAQLIK